MGVKIEEIKDPKQRAAFAAAATPRTEPVPAFVKTKTGPKLNKTEAAFYDILRARFSDERFIIQTHSLRLIWGYKLGYLPDFAVTERISDKLIKITIYEVKGGKIWDDAMVKFKTAARMFPAFTWILAEYKKGTWTETRYA